MRPEVVSGIQERADAFLTKCTKSEGKSLNVYVSLIRFMDDRMLIDKEYLHCYALDCASHHLFHPYGTHSIEGGEDWKMMEEQSYHNSIIRQLFPFTFAITEPYLTFHDRELHPILLTYPFHYPRPNLPTTPLTYRKRLRPLFREKSRDYKSLLTGQ